MKKCIEYTCWIIEKREFCDRDIDQRESQGESAQVCNFVNFALISKLLTFLKSLWKTALTPHDESLKKASLVNALTRTKNMTRGFPGPFRRYFLNLNQSRSWNMEIDQNFELILNFIIFFSFHPHFGAQILINSSTQTHSLSLKTLLPKADRRVEKISSV